MIPTIFQFPAPDYNGIAATQSWTTATGAAVTLNGELSQQLYGTIDPANRYVVLPGIQRTIGIFSTGNLSAVVFYASGLDTNGNVITASFAGASGGSSTASDAFATFTTEFHQLNYLYATAAATSAFTVGTGATGATRWYTADAFATPFAVTLTAVTATAATMTVQNTSDDVNTATAPTTFNHATMVSMTANQQSNFAYPVRYIRAVVSTNSATNATISSLTVQQAG